MAQLLTAPAHSFYTYERCEVNYGPNTKADFPRILSRINSLQIMNLDQNLSTSVPVWAGLVLVSAQGFSRHGEYSYTAAPTCWAGLAAGSWQLGKLAAGRMLNVAKLVVMPALIIAAAAHWCRPAANQGQLITSFLCPGPVILVTGNWCQH